MHLQYTRSQSMNPEHDTLSISVEPQPQERLSSCLLVTLAVALLRPFWRRLLRLYLLRRIGSVEDPPNLRNLQQILEYFQGFPPRLLRFGSGSRFPRPDLPSKQKPRHKIVSIQETKNSMQQRPSDRYFGRCETRGVSSPRHGMCVFFSDCLGENQHLTWVLNRGRHSHGP